MNLQTSFLTPPFGFALFYLRSVAAREDYNDVVTNKRIKAVTTGQIYKGSIAFIVLQVIMVSAIVLKPELVSGNIDKGPARLNVEDTLEQVRALGREAIDSRTGHDAASEAEAFDPMKGLLEAVKKDEQQKK